MMVLILYSAGILLKMKKYTESLEGQTPLILYRENIWKANTLIELFN